MIYHLVSEDLNIPNQVIEHGKPLVIGRNRECRIKSLKCPRNYCSVQVDESRAKLLVRYTKSDDSQYFKSNQVITGPGFSYRVKIVDINPHEDDKRSTPDEDSTVHWSEHQSKSVLLGKFRGGGQSSSLIAAFDFDYTLVSPKSGKTYPVNGDDWKLLDSRLPKFISNYLEKGYRFVIVSNQGGIEKGKVNVDEVKKRFNDSIKALGVACMVLIATHDDLFRKPRLGLWSYLVETIQPTVDVDLERSFFVGDAAGRKKSLGRKADHSSADLFFALNAGLNFMLPEQFVKSAATGALVCNQAKSLLSQGDWFKPSVPRSPDQEQFILRDLSNGSKVTSLQSALPSSTHCIIFCGMSASGKSSFYRHHLKPLNYVLISRDELSQMSKCESLAQQTLAASKNCVIDNTSVDKATRAKWIQLCKAKGAIPIIFYFKLPLKHIFHNNIYRKLTLGRPTVTSVLIYTQNKKLEEPTASEGAPLFEVNFVPSFSDDSLKKLYYMYLNDK